MIGSTTPGRLAAAALLVVSTAAAQSHQVLPPAAASTAGASLDREPFGYDQVRHVSYYDRTLLAGVPTNSLLTEVAYRRDESILVPALMERRNGTTQSTPLWTVRMSNHTGSATSPSTRFPANTNVAWTTVVAARLTDFTTNFPPMPLPASGLPAFQVRMPFDAPWVFTGQSLGIDHFAYESTARSYPYYVDFVESDPGAGTAGLISPTSLGCPAGQNRAEGSAPNPGTGSLELFLFGAPATVATWACLGVSETTWNGLPLPAPLNALGLPGCFVHSDWLIALPMLTTTAGTAEFRVPVPANNFYAGVSFYGQWAVADDRVNPAFPFATSDGIKMTIGTQLNGSTFPVTTVSAVGGLANTNGGFGIVQHGRAPVVRVTW